MNQADIDRYSMEARKFVRNALADHDALEWDVAVGPDVSMGLDDYIRWLKCYDQAATPEGLKLRYELDGTITLVDDRDQREWPDPDEPHGDPLPRRCEEIESWAKGGAR